MRTAIVPPLAGLFSAAGLLFARAECHDVRFCRVDAREPDLDALRAARRRDARAHARSAASEWQRVADVRYRGQSWSVPIDFPGEIDAASRRRARRAVRGRARAALRHAARARARRSTSARCASSRSAPSAPPFALPRRASRDAGGTRARRLRPRTARSRRRSSLARLARRAAPTGPLLVDEYDTTVVVPPGWTVRLDREPARSCSTTSRSTADARPRTTTRSRVRLVGNALATLADEMATTIFRTAHSAVVRDAMDFSAALCAPVGRDGRAGGDDPAPARLDPERDADAARAASAARFAPGDVYLVNDPFDGASHTPDLFVVKPSFAGDALIGFAVTVAHHGDVGGRVPGHDRVRQHRGLPGGAAPAVAEARRPRRAGRGAVRDPPRERAASRTSCSATSRAQVAACHDRRPRPAGARGAATARAARRADGRPARPHRAAAARARSRAGPTASRSSPTTSARTGSTSATCRSPCGSPSAATS